MRYIRHRLIKAREFTGKNRPEFAKELGVHRIYIYKVEMGLQDPSYVMMLRWARLLGPAVSLDIFATEQTVPAYRASA